jgi:hypothetical protein
LQDYVPLIEATNNVGSYDGIFRDAPCSFKTEEMLAMRRDISLRTTRRSGKLLVQCASTNISD